MIKPYPLMKEGSFDYAIEKEIENFDLTGDISMTVLEMFYNLFSWMYFTGSFERGLIQNKAVKKALKRIPLDNYMGNSIEYSSVLLYRKLSIKFNMKALGQGELVKSRNRSNKLIGKSEFKFEELYELYSSGGSDLSEDFLLFNDIFKTSEKKFVRPLRNMSEVLNATSKSSLVRPDLGYRISTKQLNVSDNKICKGEEDKVLYVLQDCTYSMRNYENSLKVIKGFVLNEALKNDYKVEWLLTSDEIIDSTVYTADNIKTADLGFKYMGTEVNLQTILSMDRFTDRDVVIITDGNDQFDFKINFRTNKINVISLKENVNIKNKLAKYGRFFKVKV